MTTTGDEGDGGGFDEFGHPDPGQLDPGQLEPDRLEPDRLEGEDIDPYDPLDPLDPWASAGWEGDDLTAPVDVVDAELLDDFSGRPRHRFSGRPRHRRAGLGVTRRAVREVGLAFITAGVILLLFVGYQLFGTNLAEQTSQAQLKKAFQQAIAATSSSTTTTTTAAPSQTVPTSTAPTSSPPPGGAIDHLTIPKIGLDKFVVEGVGTDDLRRGPGHYPGTALPGQLGNAAIAGHRTTYGAPFFRLNEIAAGDHIYITNTSGQNFDYVVTRSSVVSPSDVAVLNATPDAQLTLTTCNPRFEATTRLVVVASLSGPAAPVTSPVTGPAAPSFGAGEAAGETAGAANLGTGDKHAWPPALAYGAAVLVLWAATRLAINRTRRWTRAGAYAAGIVICLVPLWFCFENVVRLLPPNI